MKTFTPSTRKDLSEVNNQDKSLLTLNAFELLPYSTLDGALGQPPAPTDVVLPPAQVGLMPIRTEVIFIESNVSDYQTLIDGAKPSTEIFVLDAGQDGLAQMAQILEGRSGVDAIHIVSHGSEGSLQLGALNLTMQNLGDHATELAIIGGALDANADILLYGCSVAAGSDGAALIDALAQATQADIAASTDLTGAAVLGGDWVLESTAGQVETSLAYRDGASSSYDHLLAALGATVTSNFNTQIIGDLGSTSITDNGFTFTYGGAGAVNIWTANNGPAGSPSIDLGGSNGTVDTLSIVSATAGTTFKFSSVYVNGLGWGHGTWTVEGFLNGFSTGSQTINTGTDGNAGGINATQTLNANTNLQNVDTIVISSTTNGFNSVDFDNFVFDAPVIPGPTITSATYDASTNSLVVTGTDMTATGGAANDIDVTKLTLTGQGGATYTLTSANVDITSATQFTVALNAADQINVEGLLNKNGTSSVGGTTFNLAAAADWDVASTGNADLTNGVTVSNVQTPTITSSTYDANTGSLVVTCANLVKASGATNDITANKLTFTGEGGATYTLTDTSNVEITSGTAFTITLSATDKAQINQIINKNGTSSTGATTYNLAAADDWNTVIANGDISDATGNGITVSNVALPAITSSTYDATTGALVVTGTGFLKLSGATNDIVANKFTFTGEGGATYTLTDSSNVEITSGTAFTISLSATDKAAINQIINKNGTASTSATTYNLAAAEDWTAGAAAGVTDADLIGNGITVSNVAVPAITSSTYDATTGALVVTGTGFLSKSGATNDIVANKFTFTGEGGATYTLTDSSNVEITSGTAFTISLSATDKAAINQIVNKNGTASTSGTTYNLAAAEDWTAGAAAGVTDADLTGNGITVSNVAVPAITSASYDYSSNVLVVTGSGFLSRSGATNDIDLTKLTFTGEGGATYTLTNATGVEITSDSSFSVTLNGADLTNVEALLNKDGTSAVSSATYNLSAAASWNRGDATNGSDTSNAITVSNYAAPTVTSAIYDASTNVLTVTGTNLVSKSGASNDVAASSLSLTGEGGTYTLTSSNIDITNATTFSVTLNAADQLVVNGLLNKNGTSSSGSTTYNVAAAEDWMAGTAAATVVADLTGNGITVSNVQTPTITSSTYDSDTGVLTVTGTNLFSKVGANNDIDLTKLTFTGQGGAGAAYTLTSATGVEITSATSFSVTLTGTDKTNVDALLNQIGTSAVDTTTYNLAAANNWLAGADLAATITDATNAVTVAIAPKITSATYDAATGSLVVTGTNMQAKAGAANDITANKLTFTAEGGATYTLTDTANVELTSATSFTLTLSATDQAAINQIVNKNGTSSTGATTYNLAAADDWDAQVVAGDTSDLTGNGITVSNVALPTITSSSYNASTGALVVTGTGFLKLSGATNDIVANKFTFTGEGGATYTLTDSSNVEITSGTAFTISLSATDKAAINQIINKNGTSSTGATTYNLAAAEDWTAGAAAGVTDADLTGNGITVSNVAVPTITSSTYDATTGALVVTGNGFLKLSGATNDIDANKFTFTGEGGATYTLTDSSNVEITSGTAFTINLSATDKAAINQIINKNGTASTGATTYNLAAAEDWAAGADTAVVVADLIGNGITVSNVAVPAITSSTYDATTGALVVTGTGFLKLNGATNDIVANKFTFTGEGGATYTLTDSSNVEITSGTAFTITLSATDKAAINQIVNKNGTSSTGATTYNLAAAEDWTAGAAAGVTDADLTGNGITVSNVAVPAITSSTYDATTGALVVTGTGFLKLNGAANDIVANKFTFTGEGGATYTLTDTSNVEITSGTAFTISLSATDKAAINQITNKNGTSSTGATTYNLAAAEDWATGADAAVVVADTTGNGITVSNVAVPIITSATYVNNTGVLVVTGNNFLKLAGANNDIDASKLTFTGHGGATYTLTGTAGVEITSATEFTLTLTGADKTGVNAILNKSGLNADDNTLYNLAAAEDWAAGADAAVVVADLTGNGITVTANIAPTSSNGSVTTDEDTAYTFDVTAFQFSDADSGDTLQTVKITGLPANGTLALNDIAVTLNQEIAVAELTAGNLKFTPEANGNGDAYTTFQFQVSDGKTYSSNYPMTVNVTAVNDAPVITSGVEATVEENIATSTVVYTVTASDVDNGQIVTYSLTGTDAASFNIDADTGDVTFINSPDYESKSSYSINVVATDNGLGSLFDSQPVTVTITDVYEPPVDDDHDGQIDTVEDGVAVIPSDNGAIVGDGNGDGIADNLQTAVTSALILNTPTISNPGDAQPIYVTLVANSVDGKVGAGETAQISGFQQLDAPIDLPAKAHMPLGLFAFTATTATAGASESFSLYVDSSIRVNGYWKQNADGHWVNLASAKYGGQVVSEGGKTRLDFNIADGGQFDSDGLTNAIITDPGAAAFLPMVGRVILGNNRKNLLAGHDDSNDLVIGYKAKDVLTCGSGDDWMVGGSGAETYSYTSTTLGSGDLSAGDIDTIVDGGSRIRFSAEVLATLNLEGQTLTSLTGKHTVGQHLDSNNSLAWNNNVLQIDLNGDGTFNVADDFQIDFYARTNSKLVFNAKSDLLTLAGNGKLLAAPVNGTEDFDTLVGDSHRNTLSGVAGDDLMYGAGGKDILVGGTGDDVMVGGSGMDRYHWEAGDISPDAIDQVIDGKRSKLSFDGVLLQQLKLDGQILTDVTTKKVVLGNQIDADNSIAYHNGVVEIDVNGDGQFIAADDFQIQLVGSISKVTFDAAGDQLVLG